MNDILQNHLVKVLQRKIKQGRGSRVLAGGVAGLYGNQDKLSFE